MSVIELQAVVAPRLNQVVDGDSNAALAVLAALSLAIYHQRRTGRGQFVRTSMISGNAWCYSDDFCTYDDKPAVRICDSEYYGTSALERVYETADGWVCLAVRTQREFDALATRSGCPSFPSTSATPSAAARADNDDALAVASGPDSRTSRPPNGRPSLLAADVGCVNANLKGLPAFTSFDPVLRETGFTVEIDHPMFGPIVRGLRPSRSRRHRGRLLHHACGANTTRPSWASWATPRMRSRRWRPTAWCSHPTDNAALAGEIDPVRIAWQRIWAGSSTTAGEIPAQLCR